MWLAVPSDIVKAFTDYVTLLNILSVQGCAMSNAVLKGVPVQNQACCKHGSSEIPGGKSCRPENEERCGNSSMWPVQHKQVKIFSYYEKEMRDCVEMNDC